MSRREPAGLVRLEDGHRVAYDEYGDPDGEPVIFCHGWPSSRSMAQLTDDAARALKLRIISPDRPGISGSSFRPERKLTEWPELLRTLTRHLQIDSYRMLAVSGGAPYAFISGWAFPDQVRAIAVVSGAPPIAELSDHAGLWRVHRIMLQLHARNPAVMRAFFRVARPIACMRMSMRYRPFLRLVLQKMDAEALRDRRAFEACFESSREAWRASLEGVMADAEIYAQPWGFRLEEVTVPVHVWHGTRDRTFSFHLAEEVAKRLPNAQLRIVEGAGHYSLPIRYIDDILRELVRP
jgi:pimeloyl-ACP methyl ester carboxylesterase